jgi:hypothetical protein
VRRGWLLLVVCAACRIHFDAIGDGAAGSAREDAEGDALAGHDEDGDGVPDPIDTCPHIAQATQLDSDGDGVGDVCDPDPQNPAQRIALFDPLLSGGGFTIQFGTWQAVGDAYACDARVDFCRVRRDTPLVLGSVEVGVDIKARAAAAPQYQVLLSVEDSETSPRHYVEMFEPMSAPPGYASISYYDGNAFNPIATTPLATGMHTGRLRLAFDITPPAPTLSVAGGWGAETYATGTNFGGYPGGSGVAIGINGLSIELAYLVVITTQ